MMKAHLGLLSGLFALLVSSNLAHAQNSRDCAWPIEISPEGSGNVTGPETLARYFMIPFDTRYDTMTIKGAYPNARYFSYVAYQDETPTAIVGDLYDAQIAPDPGGVNPFVQPTPSTTASPQQPGKGTYTVVLSRTQPSSGNTIKVPSGHFVWVALRIYIPSVDPTLTGHSLTGGVPLPSVSVTKNGTSQTLPTCSPVNDMRDMTAFLKDLFGDIALNNPEDKPSSDRLWFAPPESAPMRLLPNPHNKYIAMFPGDKYQPGRLIVIHGKAPGAPDTYSGSPIWEPAPGFKSVDMRYWSLCSFNLQLPVSEVDCTSDMTTQLENGSYTIVISDDPQRPDWLPPNVNWMRWGDEGYPKFMYFRNMLTAPDFPYSVQNAIAKGCTFKFELPNIPNSDDTIKAGQCTSQVMGDYYPIAFWCDKSTFMQGGWQACMKGQ